MNGWMNSNGQTDEMTYGERKEKGEGERREEKGRDG